jgi:hypothetical protein
VGTDVFPAILSASPRLFFVFDGYPIHSTITQIILDIFMDLAQMERYELKLLYLKFKKTNSNYSTGTK